MINPEKMAEQGVDWIIHYVNGEYCEICGEESADEFPPYYANIHTHGLMDNHEHYDLCICIDIGQDMAMGILNSMGQFISRDNKVYDVGIRYDVLQKDYPVKIIKFDHEDTLFIMLPDENRRLPGDPDCSVPYCFQEEYAKLTHEENMRYHLEGTHPEDV